MVVCSAWRTGRLGAFGRYFLSCSVLFLEKITLKFALNVAWEVLLCLLGLMLPQALWMSLDMRDLGIPIEYLGM